LTLLVGLSPEADARRANLDIQLSRKLRKYKRSSALDLTNMVDIISLTDEIKASDNHVERCVARWRSVLEVVSKVDGDGEMVLVAEVALSAHDSEMGLRLSTNYLKDGSDPWLREKAWGQVIISYLRLEQVQLAKNAWEEASKELDWNRGQVLEGPSNHLSFHPVWVPLPKGSRKSKAERSVESSAAFLEGIWNVMLEELEDALYAGSIWDNMIPGQDNLVDLPGSNWEQLMLFYSDNGGFQAQGCALFPLTCRQLMRREELTTEDTKELVSARIATLAHLGPFTELDWHSGQKDTRIICSLGLKVPDGDIGLELAFGHRLSWKPGKAICFDDSVAHRAWNWSRESRWVFLFGRWHPEIQSKL